MNRLFIVIHMLLTLALSLVADPEEPCRFVDNGDGTILDTATNLVWLKDANALGRLNVKPATYWTSTPSAGDEKYNWWVFLSGGETKTGSKNSYASVWPVRGSQMNFK